MGNAVSAIPQNEIFKRSHYAYLYNPIACTTQLLAQHIDDLVNGKLLAVSVKEFLPANVASLLAQRLLKSGYGHYENAPSIGRIGMAFYEAENDPDLLAQYFDNARDSIIELRSRCAPYASPMDTLRCQLEEIWPAGAHLETLYGKKMFVGMSRIVEPDVCFLAHHDHFEKDAPDTFHAHTLEAQFSFNIYVDIPLTGGELQIWSNEIEPQEFDALRGSSYGIDPKTLGQPDLEIRPSPGDAVIFNSRKMHSVTPGSRNSRVSLSCFIGYRGKHAPLTYWS